MALIHSGYFNGIDAAEPALAPDEYNTGYQLAFEYDTYLEGSSGNTVLRIVRVYLFSALMWYPLNLLGSSPYTGDVASLGIGFNTASVTRQTTSGATGKYWAYDADQNEISNQNPGGGWSEAVTFAYDEIDYPVVYKPHAPTTVLSAGASDKAVSVNVYIEIRDGEVGYLYKGNKSISVTVPRNQWVVKLHPNGGVVDGSSAAMVTKTKYYNQTLTIPTPTKTNAVFKGWYTNAQGTGNPVSASYTQNADLELWAIWYEPYAVTYVATDSNVTNMPSPNPDVKVWNQDYTISGTKPVRSGGYMFKEWNTRSDGTGTPYAPGASYSTNAALTLYAIWFPPYGIAYNGNGGSDTASVVSNVPAMQIKSHGVALTLSSQKPTRPGYSFARWNTNSSGTGASYNPGDTYPASNNAHQVLYAIWTPTVDSKAVTVNKSVRTGSLNSETEADEGGYAFIDFSYSFVGAASGTVSVSVGRTPEGGTRTPVPAARISGDTAKSKNVGYATLSGNVKMHDDGGGSLPTTTRYKYDITVTFAGTSATGASYIEKAFFTISVLGDGVSGQTPGHGIAFGMPATRAAFEVGPSMPAHFWEVLTAHKAFTTSAGLVPDLEVGTSQLYANGLVMSNPATKYDQGWIRMLGTGESDTVLEIATGDDGGRGEQIVVRQYNTSNNIAREAKLFDTNGDTNFPGTIKQNGTAVSLNGHTHNYLEPVGDVGNINTDHATAIKNYFDANKSTIPREKLIDFRSLSYNNGAQAMGYFISGYDSNPYGGFFVAHYDKPWYVGISSGTYTQWELSKVGHTHNYAGSSSAGGSANSARMLDGFASYSSSQGWGNQTGTFVFGMNDSTGGSMAFRRDNPSGGQLSMIIDGTLYVDEGRYPVLSSANWSSYISGHKFGIDYIPAVNYGSLPSQSTDDAVYQREWLRYVWANYPYFRDGEYSGIGTLWPNSQGTVIGQMYSGTPVDSSGNPQYCSYLYSHLGGAITLFGTVNHYFYRKQLLLRYNGGVINSNMGNGTIYLTDDVSNYTHFRIQYYSNEGYNHSVTIHRSTGSIITLDLARGESGSPNKLWVKTRTIALSGTTITTYSSQYAEYGGNSTGAWSVNANNYIYINRVEAWNE